jgi:hypothetical protein
LPYDAANAFSITRAPALASWPAWCSVVAQIANGFGDYGDRLVVLPPDGRSLYRLAERLRKVIPMVAAKDSWRLQGPSAVASQAFTVCRALSQHRSSAISGRCRKDDVSRPRSHASGVAFGALQGALHTVLSLLHSRAARLEPFCSPPTRHPRSRCGSPVAQGCAAGVLKMCWKGCQNPAGVH